jgi:dTDP-4-dehydrorhamnose reductase
MRLVVTGKCGQVARCLAGIGAEYRVHVILVGRPEMDLDRPETVLPSLAAIKPDLVVNAAAYTDVDQAESEPEAASRINTGGAGAVAKASAFFGIPIIQLSTDYVFDGTKPTPYHENDSVAPCNVYGASKLAGEQAVTEAQPNHVILRTAWVFSPYGKNFLQTMVRLAQTKKEVRVVADQYGCPTSALDIAKAIIIVARRLLHDSDPLLRGVFHLTDSGETTWAGFADTIFSHLENRRNSRPVLYPITTQEYPTPARRPRNSRLDCQKLESAYAVRLPFWQSSLEECLETIEQTKKCL